MRERNGSVSEEASHVAFDLLLVEAQKRLTCMAIHFTKNVDQARDLVQDTMVRALEFRHQFQEGTSFIAWTTVIMRNILFNNYRKTKQKESANVHATAIVKASVSEYTKVCADCSPDPVMELKKVLHCLNNLPDSRNLQALNLVVFKGKSFEEAAGIMHICPVTVRTRMLRARDALLRAYDPATASKKLPKYRSFHYPRKPTPDTARVKSLRLQKYSLRDIATEMHVSVSCVRAAVRDLHLANPTTSEAVKRSWVRRREARRRYYA